MSVRCTIYDDNGEPADSTKWAEVKSRNHQFLGGWIAGNGLMRVRTRKNKNTQRGDFDIECYNSLSAQWEDVGIASGWVFTEAESSGRFWFGWNMASTSVKIKILELSDMKIKIKVTEKYSYTEGSYIITIRLGVRAIDFRLELINVSTHLKFYGWGMYMTWTSPPRFFYSPRQKTGVSDDDYTYNDRTAPWKTQEGILGFSDEKIDNFIMGFIGDSETDLAVGAGAIGNTNYGQTFSTSSTTHGYLYITACSDQPPLCEYNGGMLPGSVFIWALGMDTSEVITKGGTGLWGEAENIFAASVGAWSDEPDVDCSEGRCVECTSANDSNQVEISIQTPTAGYYYAMHAICVSFVCDNDKGRLVFNNGGSGLLPQYRVGFIDCYNASKIIHNYCIGYHYISASSPLSIYALIVGANVASSSFSIKIDQVVLFPIRNAKDLIGDVYDNLCREYEFTKQVWAVDGELEP